MLSYHALASSRTVNASPCQDQRMESTLNQVEHCTSMVANGVASALDGYKPQEATTNPSLILTTAQIPAHQKLVEEAIDYSKELSVNTKEGSRLCGHRSRYKAFI
uniref:Transaldolase n=1 Tax=Mus spicilegus TaxID=10103 RepID=A0A8C6HAL1_MUSSI